MRTAAPQRAEWRLANGKLVSGEWRMANGEGRMANGELEMANENDEGLKANSLK